VLKYAGATGKQINIVVEPMLQMKLSQGRATRQHKRLRSWLHKKTREKIALQRVSTVIGWIPHSVNAHFQ
jgi:hypothetical protein